MIMEKVEAFNPERLKWCTKQQGISLDDLARLQHISPQTLHKALSGEPTLTFTQLEKIAAFFNRGILFFLENTPVTEEQVFSPQFRTLANQKIDLTPGLKNFIQRVEKQRQVYLALLEDLGERETQEWQPHDMPATKNIKEVARYIRKWLGLGNKCDFDSFRIAVESKGILVFVSNGYQGQWKIEKENPVRGFSLYYREYPAIVIKKLDAKVAQAFTLAHELAHLLLHHNSFIDTEDDFYSHQGQEEAANAFAGNLLVPDEFIKTIDFISFASNNVDSFEQDLKPYALHWGVSVEVIVRRLMDEGRLRKKDYQNYREWKRNQPVPATTGEKRVRYRYLEPRNIFGDPFVKVVLDAYRNDVVTLAKACSYLDNIKIDYVHKLEDKYARI